MKHSEFLETGKPPLSTSAINNNVNKFMKIIFSNVSWNSELRKINNKLRRVVILLVISPIVFVTGCGFPINNEKLGAIIGNNQRIQDYSSLFLGKHSDDQCNGLSHREVSSDVSWSRLANNEYNNNNNVLSDARYIDLDCYPVLSGREKISSNDPVKIFAVAYEKIHKGNKEEYDVGVLMLRDISLFSNENREYDEQEIRRYIYINYVPEALFMMGCDEMSRGNYLAANRLFVDAAKLGYYPAWASASQAEFLESQRRLP